MPTRIPIEASIYERNISQATSESLWRLYRAGCDVDYKLRFGYGCAMPRNGARYRAIRATA